MHISITWCHGKRYFIRATINEFAPGKKGPLKRLTILTFDLGAGAGVLKMDDLSHTLQGCV